MRKTLLLGFVLLDFVGFRLALALGFAFAFFLAFGFLLALRGLGLAFRWGRRLGFPGFDAGLALRGRRFGFLRLRERGDRERRGNQRSKQFLHSGFLSPKKRSNADLLATTP